MVHVITGEWVGRLTVVVRFSGQHLMQRVPIAFERDSETGHVDTPDSIFLFADHLERFVLIGFQAIDPMPKRLGVMDAQIFNIATFQTFARHDFQHLGNMRQLTVGEHIFVDESAIFIILGLIVECDLRDAMIQD